jgi:hypothetical protein
LQHLALRDEPERLDGGRDAALPAVREHGHRISPGPVDRPAHIFDPLAHRAQQVSGSRSACLPEALVADDERVAGDLERPHSPGSSTSTGKLPSSS